MSNKVSIILPNKEFIADYIIGYLKMKYKNLRNGMDHIMRDIQQS